MLTLKEFIIETLGQIVEAAEEFESKYGEKGATMNPHIQQVDSSEWSKHGVMFAGHGSGINYATIVNFDVAITAEDSESSKLGAGIKVLSLLSTDGSLSEGSTKATASRIQFRLPLQIRTV